MEKFKPVQNGTLFFKPSRFAQIIQTKWSRFCFQREWLLRNKSFSTENLGAMMIDPISSIDIDNKQDFELAQKIFIEKNQIPRQFLQQELRVLTRY